MNKHTVLLDTTNERSVHGREHNVGYHHTLMPGMIGTERFQQLCSIEYLHEYFRQVLGGQTIHLGTGYNAQVDAMSPELKSMGPVGVVSASIHQSVAAGIKEGQKGLVTIGDDNTIMNMPDITQMMGLDGSDAATAPENLQGIFARDFGPFLKGKGSATELINCTPSNLPKVCNPDAGDEYAPVVSQPFSVSRNFGDEVAFSVLDTQLLMKGVTDWRPDGIVLSKGVNDPSDQLSNEYLEARDGQLYNIRVQGPAIGTSWSNDRSLEVLPLDKVFVVIVADVWFDAENCTSESVPQLGNSDRVTIKTLLHDNQNNLTSVSEMKDYQALRAKYMAKRFDENAFAQRQSSVFNGDVQEKTVLANFRVMVSTSSQMINHSDFKSSGNNNTDTDAKRRRLSGSSRMGLALSNDVGEYIVGGWQIGNVLDSAASRGSMPQGANIGIRSSSNSAAMNINVNISWFNADRLCRSFNNPESTVKQRFEVLSTLPKNPVNMQTSAGVFALKKSEWVKLKVKEAANAVAAAEKAAEEAAEKAAAN